MIIYKKARYLKKNFNFHFHSEICGKIIDDLKTIFEVLKKEFREKTKLLKGQGR